MTRLFLRGWLIVTLTALNVSMIAWRAFPAAFVTGCAISALWYANAGTAATDRSWRALCAYAVGAGCGTVTGMALALLLSRGVR